MSMIQAVRVRLHRQRGCNASNNVWGCNPPNFFHGTYVLQWAARDNLVHLIYSICWTDISEQNLFNWNFHWIGIGEPLTYGYHHCFWEFRRSACLQINVCVHSSFPSTSCDSVFSLHLFLIPMYSTCSHARYPSPWSSSSRYVTEYSDRMDIFMLPSSYTYLIYRLADKALMCVNCNMVPFDLWYGGVFAEWLLYNNWGECNILILWWQLIIFLLMYLSERYQP